MKFARMAIATAVVVLSTGATAQQGDWSNKVADTGRTHVVGNPQAKTTLAEFVSYTCPHCGMFAIQGEPALKLAYISPGHIKLEIHSTIRNVVDLVATMLVQCGPQDRFLQNHAMFMARQSIWLTKAQKATPAQTALWGQGNAAGFRAMASALGYYDMMEQHGYTRVDVDKCLVDNAKLQKIITNTRADATEYGIQGTPSFAINGKLLDGVHDWRQLERALNTHLTGPSLSNMAE